MKTPRVYKFLLVISIIFQSDLSWPEELPTVEPAKKEALKEEIIKYPLYFDVYDNELKIALPRVTYDLQSSKGESLDLGNGIIFDNDSFQARIENEELHFIWNAHLIPSGELSIINELGKELWKQKIVTLGNWTLKNLHGKEAPQWKNNDKFRFCLRSQQDKGYASLCSQFYAVIMDATGIQLGKTRSAANARIIFQNEEKKLKGSEEVAPGVPVQFLATLNTNASYEFVSEPLTPVIRDMVTASESGKVTLTGELPKPLKSDAIILIGEEYNKLTIALGFEKTIAARSNLWQMTISEKDDFLSLPGKAGGVFLYQLTIKNPPTERHRLFISSPVHGTYLNQDQFLFMDLEDKITTSSYTAPEKFMLNRVTLESTADRLTHKSYLDIYRGSSGEASLRLTGVGTTDGSFVVLGETHLSWWFNDIFGWQNSYLSKQRWGVSARVFSSLVDFPISTGGGASEDTSLSVMQVDLRYRLNPGLWKGMKQSV